MPLLSFPSSSILIVNGLMSRLVFPGLPSKLLWADLNSILRLLSFSRLVCSFLILSKYSKCTFEGFLDRILAKFMVCSLAKSLALIDMVSLFSKFNTGSVPNLETNKLWSKNTLEETKGTFCLVNIFAGVFLAHLVKFLLNDSLKMGFFLS